MIKFHQLTEAEWLAERRKFIGGSDAAAVCDVSPWASAFDVWLSKTQGEIKEETPAMYWGHKHETALIEWLEGELRQENPDIKVYPLTRIVFRHAEFRFMGCSPDGLVADKTGIIGLVEAKTTSDHMRDRWGEEMTDNVATEVIIQCLHNLIVASSSLGRPIPTCYVPLFVGGNKALQFRVGRNAETEARIMRAEANFWTKHVITGNEPDYGDSPGAAQYLKDKYPADTADVEVATDAEAGQIARLKLLFDAHRASEHQYKGQVNKVKDLIGERAGIVGPDGKITWKKTADGKETDWRAVAYQLQPLINEATFEAAVGEHTTQKSGYRRFCVPKEWRS